MNYSIIDKIWLRDLYTNIILKEVNQLPHPDNKIGKLAFIDDLNDTQIAEVLTYSTNYCCISKEDNSKTNSGKNLKIFVKLNNIFRLDG